MESTEFSLKIYEEILEFSKENNISFRKISKDIDVKDTTFMTWIENVKNGKCISVNNILKIQKYIGKNFFVKWIRLIRIKLYTVKSD